MNERYLKLAAGMFVVTGISIFFALDVGSQGNYSQPQTKDFPKISAWIPSIFPEKPITPENDANKPVTKQDLRRIRQLDFPECKNLGKTNIDVGEDCSKRIQLEGSRIAKIRDSKMVPELIKIAKQQKFGNAKSHFITQHCEVSYNRSDYAKRQCWNEICILRVRAVYALGKMKDQRAIDSLIEIINEKESSDTTCDVFGEEYPFCSHVIKSLVEINPHGVSDKVINFIKVSSHLSDPSYVRVVGDLCDGNYDIHASMLAARNSIRCDIDLLSQMGDEGRKAIFEQINDGKLNSFVFVQLLDIVGKYLLTPEETDIIAKYINYGDSESDYSIEAAANYSICNNPVATNKQIYLKIVSNPHYHDCALLALGAIKAPEALQIIQVAVKGNWKISDGEAGALSSFSSEEIRPFLPYLLGNFDDETCSKRGEWIATSIVKLQDPSVISQLLKKARKNNCYAIEAIGKIRSEQSVRALESLISDPKYGKRDRALLWYFYQVGPTGKDFALKYFDQDQVNEAMRVAQLQDGYGK